MGHHKAVARNQHHNFRDQRRFWTRESPQGKAGDGCGTGHFQLLMALRGPCCWPGREDLGTNPAWFQAEPVVCTWSLVPVTVLSAGSRAAGAARARQRAAVPVDHGSWPWPWQSRHPLRVHPCLGSCRVLRGVILVLGPSRLDTKVMDWPMGSR